MKLTIEKIKQLIKEELEKLDESIPPDDSDFVFKGCEDQELMNMEMPYKRYDEMTTKELYKAFCGANHYKSKHAAGEELRRRGLPARPLDKLGREKF